MSESANPKLITVASIVPCAVRLREPHQNLERPGDLPDPRHVVILGGSEAVPGITRGVDAEVFKAWLEANPHHPAVTSGHIWEISEDDERRLEDSSLEFGHEAHLKRAAEDKENVETAAKGAEWDAPPASRSTPLSPESTTDSLRQSRKAESQMPEDVVDSSRQSKKIESPAASKV